MARESTLMMTISPSFLQPLHHQVDYSHNGSFQSIIPPKMSQILARLISSPDRFYPQLLLQILDNTCPKSQIYSSPFV